MREMVSKKISFELVGSIFCLIAALVVLAAACNGGSNVGNTQPNPQAGASGSASGSGGSKGGAGGAAGGAPQGTECAPANITQPCTCPNGDKTAPGRQVCSYYLKWGDCQCYQVASTLPSDITGKADPADNKRADVTFDWERTMPHGGSCEAGYYEGTFTGIYNSQAMILITLSFEPSLPVMGDVKFNILEKPGSNGEFFEISDGHFKGSALMAFPFDGDFKGELDCNTLTFTGTLDNCYYMVGNDKYAFQGIALSKYDPIQHTFVDGVWSVTEPTGNAIFLSPSNPDAGYPDAAAFPAPLPVSPGTPLPAFYPVGFEGGTGNWNAAFKSSTPAQL